MDRRLAAEGAFRTADEQLAAMAATDGVAVPIPEEPQADAAGQLDDVPRSQGVASDERGRPIVEGSVNTGFVGVQSVWVAPVQRSGSMVLAATGAAPAAADVVPAATGVVHADAQDPALQAPHGQPMSFSPSATGHAMVGGSDGGLVGGMGPDHPPGLNPSSMSMGAMGSNMSFSAAMDDVPVNPFWSPERRAYERLGVAWERQQASEGAFQRELEGTGQPGFEPTQRPMEQHGWVDEKGVRHVREVPAMKSNPETPQKDVVTDPIELFRIRCMREAEERFRQGLEQMRKEQGQHQQSSSGSYASALEDPAEASLRMSCLVVMGMLDHAKCFMFQFRHRYPLYLQCRLGLVRVVVRR